MEDRQSCEKMSIRDSAKSLKKYGSTSKHIMRNPNLIKHIVTSSDTLQGISLKYSVTMEQIRRLNRLWASDSLFLREYLLIPVPNNSALPTDVEPSTLKNCSIEPLTDDTQDISSLLVKIDNSIANTKEEVMRSRGNSEFASNLECDFPNVRKKPAVSRMKQLVNNNSCPDVVVTPSARVISHGQKLRSSLQRLEQEQDEIFEL